MGRCVRKTIWLSDQVRHKPTYAVTEDQSHTCKIDISDLRRREIEQLMNIDGSISCY